MPICEYFHYFLNITNTKYFNYQLLFQTKIIIQKSRMNSQVPSIKKSCFEILIPESKRFHNEAKPDNICFFNSPLTIQSPIENQLHNLKPQLNLRPEKSVFSLVSLQEQDMTGNFRSDTEYQKNNGQLQKLVYFLTYQCKNEQQQAKQINFNTKNILRNICNAQNQYILFNQKAKQIIQNHLEEIQKFKNWVNTLRIHTFQQFQNLWDRRNKHIYLKIYKKLCKKFYIENAIPYIMNSRIKNRKTKLAHLKYLYRFLQGLQTPESFCYFKHKEQNISRK